jgi:hypothetical protein
MRIGVIACEILKNEIEQLIEGDPEVIHKEYLEMGLHDQPEVLLETLTRKINGLEGKVDIVFLGYAICKSLNDIPTDLKVPIVMLREEDCVASMLGPLEYAHERSKCPGTWFSSPGWAILGIDAVVDDRQMEGLEELGYDKMYFVKKELDAYSRCLYIDTGIHDDGTYQEQARKFADITGLKYECRKGDIASIKRAWQLVKSYSGDRRD